MRIITCITTILFVQISPLFLAYGQEDTRQQKPSATADSAEPQPLFTMEPDADVVVLSRDQSLLFAAHSRKQKNEQRLNEGTIKMWCLNGVPSTVLWQWRCMGYTANAIAVSPNGKTLAVACTDGKTRLWTMPTGRFLRSVPPVANKADSGATSVAFSSDGATLAIGSPTTRLLSRSPDPNIKSIIRLFDLQVRTKQRAIDIPGYVQAMLFAPDDQLLAVSYAMHSSNQVFGYDAYSASLDISGAGLYNIGTGKQEANSAPVYSSYRDALAFSRDGTVLLVGRGYANLSLFDVKNAKEATRRKVVLPSGHGGFGRTVVTLAPDGDHVAIGRNNRIELYDTTTSDLEQTLSMPGTIAFVEYTRDGSQLLSIEHSGTVRSLPLSPGTATPASEQTASKLTAG